MKTTEKLPLNDYLVYESKLSIIDKTKTITEIAGLICPYCGKLNKPIEHFEKAVCECGLEMSVLGNSLICTLNH